MGTTRTCGNVSFHATHSPRWVSSQGCVPKGCQTTRWHVFNINPSMLAWPVVRNCQRRSQSCKADRGCHKRTKLSNLGAKGVVSSCVYSFCCSLSLCPSSSQWRPLVSVCWVSWCKWPLRMHVAMSYANRLQIWISGKHNPQIRECRLNIQKRKAFVSYAAPPAQPRPPPLHPHARYASGHDQVISNQEVSSCLWWRAILEGGVLHPQDLLRRKHLKGKLWQTTSKLDENTGLPEAPEALEINAWHISFSVGQTCLSSR